MNIDSNWLPSSANVNALPEPLRIYIRDLETKCDPAGTVRELAMAKDVIRELEASNATLRRHLAHFEANK